MTRLLRTLHRGLLTSLALLLAATAMSMQSTPVTHDRILADQLRTGLVLEVSWIDDEENPQVGDSGSDLSVITESVSSEAMQRGGPL